MTSDYFNDQGGTSDLGDFADIGTGRFAAAGREGRDRRRAGERRAASRPAEAVEREPRRWIVIACVVGLLAAGFGANAATTRSSASAAASTVPQQLAGGVVAASARSSAWYCSGPLPVGHGAAWSQISLANVTQQPVIGQVVVVRSKGPSTATEVTVPAEGQATVALPSSGPEASAAAEVYLNGGGVGVEEVVGGAYPSVTSPCVSAPGQSWFFATGSTKEPAMILLSVLNPGTSSAVASISFATSGGEVLPPAYQAVVIAPGAIATFAVDNVVFGERVVATSVQVSEGKVVAGEWQQGRTGDGTWRSLLGGSAARPSWYFAAGGAKNLVDSYRLFDPGRRLTHVEVEFVYRSGVVERVALGVAANAIATVTAPAPPKGAGSSAQAVVLHSSPLPIVAARLLAGSPGGHAIFDESSGSPAAARTWVLPGGEVTKATGERVIVSNPDSHPATVTIEALGTATGRRHGAVGTTRGGEAVFPGLAGVRVAPYSRLAISVHGFLVEARLALVVIANRPVVAEQALYGLRSAGVSVASGIPVD